MNERDDERTNLPPTHDEATASRVDPRLPYQRPQITLRRSLGKAVLSSSPVIGDGDG